MSNPFSRTTRSLKADSYSLSVTGLIIAALAMTAWCAWFFMSEVSVYRTSTSASVTGKDVLVSEFPQDGRRAREIREKSIIAQFLPGEIGDIRPGQAATVYLKGKGQIPATVARVINQHDRALVELFARLDEDAPVHIQEGETGQVKIEVKYVSPASLVMHASGIISDIREISHPGKNKKEPGR
ncbi:hypothetical protein QUF80_10020 [Desulfococcaceae bacterium HSG8]|nr:hypothetical protein [Desulfococcaceae bacterium HSG8]